MIFSPLFQFGLTLVIWALSVEAMPPYKYSNLKFYCMHSSDPTYKETRISVEDISKNLDLSLDFAFFVHGWKSKAVDQDQGVKLDSIWIDPELNSVELSELQEYSVKYKIGVEWVKAKKINFCGVDWREMADDQYEDSVDRIKYVGKGIAAFVEVLVGLKVDMDRVSIAGHSLGAHAAGFAGKTIYESVGSKISTIFALDPAGLHFTTGRWIYASDFVLSNRDAKFVQVLHTTSFITGTSENLGYADFFLNNGWTQAACLGKELIGCSHSHAIDIFLTSFKHKCLGGNHVSSDIFGIESSRKPGEFKLKTTKKAPYCEV